MTSRNLFFELMIEDLKRRIWSLALVTLTFILILPIRCALEAERYTYMDKAMQYFLNFMGPVNPALFALTVACALVIGLSGFFYLHSRKKVDLYHSIPVRRETLFTIGYINGILIFILPYIVNVSICFIILKLKNFTDAGIYSAAFTAIAINMLFYCLIYTVTILAVMLTGNIIISCLGTAVFLLYGPLLFGLKELYFQGFFKTFYRNEDSSGFYLFLSPLWTYYGVTSKYSFEKYSDLIITAAVTLLIFIALAVFLYKKRPSEAAGSAMSFGISKPIIKFLLVIPAALAGGIVLRSIVSSNNDGWFIFGLFFVLIIAYALVQIIYSFDIRSAFKQKRQLLACFIITVAVAGIFRFDLLRINAYIPDKKDIEYMSVYISGIDDQLQNIDYPDYIQLGHSFSERNNLEHMTLTDFTAAYELAKLGIKAIDKMNGKYYSIKPDGDYDYIVKYTLKSGRKVYRKYYLSVDNSRELLKAVYDNKEFKRAHFPLNYIETKDINQVLVRYAGDILNYTASDTYSNGNIEITDKTNSKAIKELIETYLDELNNHSYEDTANSYPAAVFDIITDNNSLYNYYIYPSFTKTMALLDKLGFDIAKSIDTKNITQISIHNSTEILYNNNNGSVEAEELAKEFKTVSYTDPEQIAEIFPALVDEKFYQNNQIIAGVEKGLKVIVEYNNGDNALPQSFYFNFISDRIPDFVTNDLNRAEK